MRVLCQRKKLIELCDGVAPAVSAKKIKEVLSCIRFEAKGDRVSIEAANLEMSIRMEMPAEVKEDGVTLLQLEKFREILRELDSDDVSIDLVNERNVIGGGFSEFELGTFDVASFPTIAVQFDDACCSEIEADTFALMAARTLFARLKASETQKFGTFSGIKLDCEDGVLKMIASCDKCLAVMPGQVKHYGDHEKKIVKQLSPVPAELIEAITGVFKSGLIQFAVTDNSLSVKSEHAFVVGRLMEGRYPAWRKVLQKYFKTKLQFKAGDLSRLIRHAELMTDAERIAITFDIGGGKVVAGAESCNSAKSKSELNVETNGSEICIRFNPKYTLSCLSQIGKDEMVTMNVNEPKKPFEIWYGDYRFLGVPIWIQEEKKWEVSA